MKYVDSKVVFQEVPGEVTMALTISNCNNSCSGCHSPHLRDDIGTELTIESLYEIVYPYSDYVTAVCFLGDGDEQAIPLLKFIKNTLKLKTCIYSGGNAIKEDLLPYLDYYKVGEYISDVGGINSKSTNQRMYKINDGKLNDITSEFWR